MPKVSVIIPVFNREAMLLRAASSVLNQSYNDFELIIVNDGSKESLNEAKSEINKDNRVIWIDHESNFGVARARNTALNVAKGEWIALLDSDDAWHKNKLEKQLNYHSENPKYLFSQTLEDWYRDGVKVNKMNKHAQPIGNAFLNSLKLCCISSSSVLVNKRIYDEIGIYDTNLEVCEDYDFWIRATSKFEIGLVDEILVDKFGGHPDQLSKLKPAMDRYRVYAILKLLLMDNLSEENFKLALDELKYKSNVLYLGAKKRNNELKDLYYELANINSDANFSEYKNLILKKSIFSLSTS